jgi:nucleoside-diphosphate-sugar epimerase
MLVQELDTALFCIRVVCHFGILQHVDHYSRTKAVAEMKVLAANSEVQPVLRTCALRLAGVYGPGEERHLPRVVVSHTATFV